MLNISTKLLKTGFGGTQVEYSVCSLWRSALGQTCFVEVAWILSFKDDAKVGDMWPGYLERRGKAPQAGWESIKQQSKDDLMSW